MAKRVILAWASVRQWPLTRSSGVAADAEVDDSRPRPDGHPKRNAGPSLVAEVEASGVADPARAEPARQESNPARGTRIAPTNRYAVTPGSRKLNECTY